ncbi:VOC family protein [Streptomyces ipomoeae]|uniref:VOC family protein n=1 Tax=Streptomyces ipomoeae TaxID=103232 RepID=UPI001146779C|nr:VOC family protein [Streptomyces ipomoeae]MDX2938845.1 VOC family protein [Streptomyces ipomoeae]TQE21286.1 VOC family protein [Streptomyces ipomoeae]
MTEPIRWTYAFIDRPAADFARACAFWTAVTGTTLSEPRGDQAEFVTLLPKDTDPSLKAQSVTTGPGGAHLDLCVENVPALIAHATALGAEVVTPHSTWAVLRSPAGQLFCAVTWHGESVRPPVFEGTRVDQLCLDVPPAAFDTEITFWTTLTGWNSHPGSRPEFHVLNPPPGLPHRLLLQRLNTPRPASAHLDLSCTNIPDSQTHHEHLGATFTTAHPHWTVMQDPTTTPYCLTSRDPESGRLPPGTAPRPQGARGTERGRRGGSPWGWWGSPRSGEVESGGG